MSDRTMLGQTPSQTVGPYFAYGLSPQQYGYEMTSLAGSTLADETVPGTRIHIEGRVFDGRGEPIDDALIEIWHADAEGQYVRPAGVNSRFLGFGRCGTGTHPEAKFWFETIKPGIVFGEAANGPDASGAPHINVTVLMRGLLLHAFTRIYFPDEAAANANDPFLALVPEERRSTLIATEMAPGRYTFDIHMQGENETVFFDI